ncbi:hypothetical protein SEPB62_02789 [Salmonella enterica subsp. enterica serovar Paratyphi B str. SARA62]|nr:hypothetical protein SEPB62_02789 [Salmonella enterica subsp. enterica serovar Paratyphi B str. SARA62]
MVLPLVAEVVHQMVYREGPVRDNYYLVLMARGKEQEVGSLKHHRLKPYSVLPEIAQVTGEESIWLKSMNQVSYIHECLQILVWILVGLKVLSTYLLTLRGFL